VNSIMLQHVPKNWRIERLGQLFSERKEKVSDEDFEPLSVTKNGIVPQMEHVAKSDDRGNRKKVCVGDFVINSRSDRKGSSGLSDYDGSVSLISIVLEPRHGHPRFLHHLMKSYAFQEEFYRFGHGIVADLWTTRFSEMKGIQVGLPDLTTQKVIADFLDCETIRIDQLIEKKQSIIELFHQKLESLVHEGIIASSTENGRFGFAATRVSRPVDLKSGASFVRLGLYNRGRGAFKKLEADEEDMGDSTFFWVEPGDLILSGQFAWEGAVALAGAGEAGCVVSHRYPVYSGTKRATTAYLLAFFRTKMGDFILNEASRGSAGRNRPLNVNRLEKEKIPIPSATLQARIGEIVSLEMEIRRKIQTSIDLLQEHRSTVITAAVTGQIDVATWGKRGTSDRRLDAIEADINATQPERQQVRA
jgi:type I restriction enzyme, S subunit